MRFVRGITRTRYYVGVLNEAPVYISHSSKSITCELFFSYREARRQYAEVCRVEIEPVIKVLGGAESVVPKPWHATKEPLLEKEYRRKWFTEWWHRMSVRIQTRWHKFKQIFSKKRNSTNG